MKAAAYLRVSTAAQAGEERFGYERQRGDIERYAAQNGLELVAEFRDAITGTGVTRVGLETLKSERARFDAVLIASIDRMGRNTSANAKVLAALLDMGLRVYAADFGLIDLSDDLSLIQYTTHSLFAHLERNKIVARTRAAHRAMAEKGLLPTGIKTYGFRNDGGVAIHDPVKAAVVRQIFEWSAQGQSQWSIQEELNRRGVSVPRPSQRRSMPVPLWHRTVISKILHNPAYKGEYRWGAFPIAVPPIVSPELWEAAQPRKRGRASATGWPLVGHLRCGVCGRRMQARSGGLRQSGTRKPDYYRCQSASLPGVSCGAPNINRQGLEAAAEQLLRETLADPETLRKFLDANQKPDPRLGQAIAELRAEDARWLEAFRLGAITPVELAAYRADAEAKRRALTTREVSPEYPLETFMLAAKEAGFRELIELMRAMFIATKGTLDLIQE